MNILSLVEASKDFGIKTLFKDLTIHIQAKDRLGIIGPNGSGKSTLMNILGGLEVLNTGKRICSKNLKISISSQEELLNDDDSVIECVLNNCEDKRDLLLTFNKISNLVGKDPTNKKLLEKLARTSELMDQSDAWNIEAKIKEILSRLGIKKLNICIRELSGGYRKRVSLACALISNPDILLLDEPTNHLDTNAVEWLQQWLKKYSGTVILITHDRYFLDKVTDRMIEISQGEATLYKGNYTNYLKLNSEKQIAKNNYDTKFQGILRRELAWLKQGPKARSTKQKARIKRIEEMREQEIVGSRKKLEIQSAARRIGKLIIEAKEIEITTNGQKSGDSLVRDFSYDFNKEDRIGIIGPNGIGKSTLLDVLSGKKKPIAGKVNIGETIKIGYLDQNTENLNEGKGLNRKIIEYVEEIAQRITIEKNEISASQLLEQFLFPPSQQYSPLSKLSGGEKRRLTLCRMLMSSPNVIMLDEPTNDLDIPTLSILEDYLESFEGCVIIISHDRYFLDRTVDRIFSFEEGKLKRFEGNYSSFLEKNINKSINTSQSSDQKDLSRNKFSNKTQKQYQSKSNHISRKNRVMSFKEAKEIREIEETLPILEKRRKSIEDSLSKGKGDLTKESNDLAELVKLINKNEERWLEISEFSN